jgi:hypothetical protein
MAAFPEPQPGLVISYAYLWSDEADQGLVEGRKDRPCAIIVAIESPEKGLRKQVAVVPITHTPPRDPNVAVEIPIRVKEHLGLDAERSWIILDEYNVFIWPGFDLRPIRGREGRVDYGFLPPRLFDSLIEKIKQLEQAVELERISRDQWREGSFAWRCSCLVNGSLQKR